MKGILVNGEDYAAMFIEDDYGIEKAYELAVSNGGKVYIDEVYGSAMVTVYEFGEVDSNFIVFVKSQLLDYDHSKSENFFVVEGKS